MGFFKDLFKEDETSKRMFLEEARKKRSEQELLKLLKDTAFPEGWTEDELCSEAEATPLECKALLKTHNAKCFVSEDGTERWTLIKSMGRLKFLLCSLTVGFVFGILFFVLAELKWTLPLFFLIFISYIFISILVERRTNSIGIFWGEGTIASIYFLYSIVMVIWMFSVAPSDDVLQSITPVIISNIIGIPLSAFLLFMPSQRTMKSFNEKRALKKIQKSLLKEKKTLTQKQEIERLKQEISTLKSETESSNA